MLSSLYRLATDLGAPFITFYLWRRRLNGREDKERYLERFGHPSRPRPAGRVVWCHAASVGEAASILILVDRLHETYPDISVLVTTGTVTAGRLIMPRLPSYAIHQYVPIDRALCVNRFLDHWTPALAIWTESELWPNTLLAVKRRKIPALLLNARISERSFRNWHRFKGFARQLLSTFSLSLAQTEDDRGRFIALGATPVKCLGNLKYASVPLPYDEAVVSSFEKQLEGRPLWMMSSTHRGEDNFAFAVHEALSSQYPRLLTVIVPRHPTRGDEIARMAAASGLTYALRSQNQRIDQSVQVYIADTMGELGNFYRVCPIVVMGGSFIPVGGHNPIEAAQLGAAIIFGPFMYNFSEVAQEFVVARAAVQLQHSNEMSFAVGRLLASPEERLHRGKNARILADQKRSVLDKIIREMEPWLKE